MEAIILVVFGALAYYIWHLRSARRSEAGEAPTTKITKMTGRTKKYKDDYERWTSILSDEGQRRVKEFDLFGTRAAIVWSSLVNEVNVVCITSFTRGTPQSKNYDYFSFNIVEWYWSGKAPRGCADRIKEEIKAALAEGTT